jgi:ABC-type multidrug transport system fused ATPase/permease subunit
VVREPATPRALPTGPHTVRLSGVSAGWPGAPTCLRDVDLVLAPGRRVAVVGDSGAGKSTLAAVLLRFLDPSAGRYLIDDIDATTCAGDDVRAVVVAVGQDSYLFDHTVRANLLLARPTAGEDELWSALDGVDLADWLRAQPKGLDTPVGAGGARLSGGQARRLVIARALLAQPEVLLLDEPTEHLDRRAARALLADLDRLTAGRTTLVITHDLRGLERFDEIVVLRGGDVVERGTHDQLLAAHGTYCELWLSRDQSPGSFRTSASFHHAGDARR